MPRRRAEAARRRVHAAAVRCIAGALTVACGGLVAPALVAGQQPVSKAADAVLETAAAPVTTAASATGVTITPALLAAARAACGEPPGIPTAVALDFAVDAVRWGLTLGGAQELRFVRSGERYRMTGTMRAAAGLFNIDATSNGQIADGLLRPAEYVEKRGGRDAQRTTLDWGAQQAQFNGADPAPTQARMQDRLTLQLQLGWLLRREPAAPTLEVPVAGVRRASVYHFARRGSEPLSLPGGTLETIRLERTDPVDEHLEVWIAPTLCWSPARIRYRDTDGGVVDQKLRAVRFGAAALDR